MLAPAPARRRPRPVADAPPLDGREVARAWLVAMVAAAPLDRGAALPGEGFADEAPRLCAAVGAALSSDAAWADLQPGGAHAPVAERVGAMAGAGGGAAALDAVEHLRGATWSALTDALDRPTPAQVADLADRLAAVISTLAVATIEADARRRRDLRGGPLAAVLAGADRARTAATESVRAEEPPTAGAPLADASVAPPAGSDGDGFESRPVTDHPPDERGAERGLGRRAEDPEDFVPRRRGTGAPASLDAPDAPLAHVARFPAPAPAADVPVVEDASTFHAARVAPWTAAIERRLSRRHEDGLPFAVLCVEVADLDRLVAADESRDVALALEGAEAAALAQLRPADTLVRERPGRLWLVAPDTDDEAARGLAHRIAAAVAGVSAHRGTPLEAATGIAVCPDDGDDASHLEGRAEEGLFAARAAGLRVAARPADPTG